MGLLFSAQIIFTSQSMVGFPILVTATSETMVCLFSRSSEIHSAAQVKCELYQFQESHWQGKSIPLMTGATDNLLVQGKRQCSAWLLCLAEDSYAVISSYFQGHLS